MSHIVRLECEVKSLECLREAAAQLGLEFVAQHTYRWYGRSVGDAPLPAGFAAEDLGKCEYALRVPGSTVAYEVGVARRKDRKPGWVLLFDEWREGFGLVEHIGEGGCRLKQEYAIAAARKQMLREGYKVTRTTNAATGKPQLRMRRA